jgi:uncharacterized protein
VKVELRAKGHRNVLSTHRNTFEFTQEEHLTPRGDCIVAVAADKTMADLPEEFKAALRREDAGIEITIECGGQAEKVTASGSPKLLLTHPTDFVIRRSDFICARTLAVRADKAAVDLSRQLVEELKRGGPVLIKLDVS